MRWLGASSLGASACEHCGCAQVLKATPARTAPMASLELLVQVADRASPVCQATWALRAHPESRARLDRRASPAARATLVHLAIPATPARPVGSGWQAHPARQECLVRLEPPASSPSAAILEIRQYQQWRRHRRHQGHRRHRRHRS